MAPRSGAGRDSEITVYKAMGIAMEDLVAANLAFQGAKLVQGGGSMAW
jgi:alanine dehydrogenase